MDILDIAKRECKGLATEEEVNWITSPQNHVEWHRALSEALAEFESQMLYHKTRVERAADDAKVGIISKSQYAEESEKFESWNRKALRYRSGIISRMAEVKAMIDDDPTFDFKKKYHDLADAINKHKIATETAGMTPEKHDTDLWESISK